MMQHAVKKHISCLDIVQMAIITCNQWIKNTTVKDKRMQVCLLNSIFSWLNAVNMCFYIHMCIYVYLMLGVRRWLA